jgi:hypothetical protein
MSETRRYVVRLDNGHDELVEAPSALDAAKAAKAGYDGGQHRVLRVLCGAETPGGEAA